MSFNEDFVVYNYTPYEMTLDAGSSKNLDDSWPSTIPAATNGSPGVSQFSQNESLININPTAVYILQSEPAVNATLHFYCWGAGFVHVNMTLGYSSTPSFSSAIEETNRPGTPMTASGTNNLEIDDNGNISSRGTATFVIGQGSIPS
jgi:hypothetical protein